MGKLQLLAADESTVLFDLDDPSGVANPNAVKTRLAAGVDLGSAGSSIMLFETTERSFRTDATIRPVPFTIPILAKAATYDDLAAGLGQLTRWLVDPPGPLRWTEGGQTRFIDLLGAEEFPALLRGQSVGAVIPSRADAMGPLPIRFLRQPYLRGLEITSSSATVPNDPATSTKVRTFPITVLGDLPTPAKVRVTVDADANALQTSAAADDIIDCTSHGFEVGDAVIFTALTGGAGLTVGTVYYVIAANLAANTFQVSATPGGAAVNFTTDITAGSVKLAGTVAAIQLAYRSLGSKPSSVFADYLSDTGFLQLEATGRNWTITLGTDTTGQVDEQGSPGGGGSTLARTSFATVATTARRVRATRTTALDSLRGRWDVWIRCKTTAIGEHGLSLHWGPSTADPADITEPEVRHEVPLGATVFGFVELKLATIQIPDGITLSGLALEVWARRISGAGNLDTDFLWLTPADNQGVIGIGGTTTQWLGNELVTPSGITGDAVWAAGTDSGTQRVLNATNEAAGTPPAAGFDPPDGYHLVTFVVTSPPGFSGSSKVRITNETDNVEVAAISATLYLVGQTRVWQIIFQAVPGKSYLYGVYDITNTAGQLNVVSITDEFLPVLADLEGARTDPGPRYAVDRLNGAGNLAGFLPMSGEVVATLLPGANHIMVRCDEIALPQYSEPENKLPRTPSVIVAYSPRYAL